MHNTKIIIKSFVSIAASEEGLLGICTCVGSGVGDNVGEAELYNTLTAWITTASAVTLLKTWIE